ncbi:hypothetical protein [Paenibacillus sp. MBLB4367]|uniref:hypothetical protein n=1 Tax=Paenibacillus sp. MBLB4367 TaxID=3384767 RepID=UPI0039081AB9
MMKRTGRLLSIGMLSAILLLCGGCGEYGPKDKYRENRTGIRYGAHKDVYPDTSGPKAYGSPQQEGTILHGNTQLAYSQKLSDQVGALNGVGSSIVMLTDNNAYVAILIDNTGNNTYGRNARKELNNSGTSLGRYNPHSGGSYMDPKDLTNGVNNFYTVEDHNDLTHEFKQKIASTVRLGQPAVHDVYISANRDFVNKMNALAQESWSGHSLTGHVGEFNTIANRIFGTPERPRE